MQMPPVWGPASHLFFSQKLSHGRCRSRFLRFFLFPFFFIVFAALALIEARLDAAPTLVILFLYTRSFVKGKKVYFFYLLFTLLHFINGLPLPPDDLSFAYRD